MTKTEIRVGRSLDEAGADFVTAWTAAEAGRPAEPVDRITFVDWNALCSVLTPKRYALMRHLRGEAASGVRSLARALDRDVKRVHEDVVALAAIGLIERADDGSLSVSLDEIASTIRFAA